MIRRKDSAPCGCEMQVELDGPQWEREDRIEWRDVASIERTILSGTRHYFTMHWPVLAADEYCEWTQGESIPVIREGELP